MVLNTTIWIMHKMLEFISELFIYLDKPGILTIKSKRYKLSISSWNEIHDDKHWLFKTESCVLLECCKL